VLHNDASAVVTTARRILMIEDEPGIRSFASRALSTAGFTVDEAADGREGLRIARSEPSDFVLLDLGLPDLAGEEVLRCLRQERPDQAVLVWSATADRDAERRCLLLGARACLRKPVPVAELLRSIGAAGRPAAHSLRFGAGLIQRQGHGMTSAGGSHPDFHDRQGGTSAIPKTDSRGLPDPGGPHTSAPPAAGRGAARRFLSSRSRRVRVQHQELNVWHRAGGGAS
jgi:DNA-binding response OmpR family regulator